MFFPQNPLDDVNVTPSLRISEMVIFCIVSHSEVLILFIFSPEIPEIRKKASKRVIPTLSRRMESLTPGNPLAYMKTNSE